ncbi:MAG: alanine--glyoxylate aminotransferase family protein [Deltaproteobacteria bacterium]|nr:alanine--glyoxylate aminotransferase family protein [Deltaproteobacteria bacterium]
MSLIPPSKVFPPPERLLLGPGPSQVHPRVLAALGLPLVGHLDPAFVALMDETKRMLREVFGTTNGLTIPISGTGSAGLEAAIVNLVEPGDEVVVGVNGVFGTRLTDVAERAGATVVRAEAPWGEVVPAGTIAAALGRARKPRLLVLVHAETSTGAWQPLEEASRLAHEHGALFVIDCVTSLGGCPVDVDRMGVDAAYSGTQKCLSCPPGLSPVTFGPRAVERLRARTHKVQSWYLDLTMLEKYWGEERVYHHTAPISMNYALYEALRVVLEEGLDARFARHRRNHEALVAGLEALGLAMAVAPERRLWMLSSVRIPAGVDDAAVRRALLEEDRIEIGGGLGPLKGQTWRIGLMGESSTDASVRRLLTALGRVLPRHGFGCDAGVALAAADRVYGAA